MSLDLDRIRAAHERIRPHIHRTPVLTSERLDEASGAKLFFKCENFQKIGAFKARGATNAVFALEDAIAKRGVATHSSGNHGTALARAAKLRGIPAHIVMPKNSAKVKVRAVESYGAHVVFCEPMQHAREAACADVIAKTDATLIHSFENEDVMAGQGTIGLELLEQVPQLEAVVVPIGGGGLISGVACAIKESRPEVRVVGVQTSRLPSMAAAVEAHQPVTIEPATTIADGIAVRRAGSLTLPVVEQYVDEIVTVSEDGNVGSRHGHICNNCCRSH